MDFYELLTKYGAFSLHKQFLLSEFLEEHNWSYNSESCKITFNDDSQLSYHASILGTHSDITNTFLHSWANQVSNIPVQALEDAQRLHKIAKRKNVQELLEAKFKTTDEINGFSIALVASGLLGLDAVYVGYHDKGAIFLLIKDLSFPLLHNDNPLFIENCFMAFISSYTIENHKEAFLNYVKSLQFNVLESKSKVIVLRNNTKILSAEFDESNKLLLLNF